MHWNIFIRVAKSSVKHHLSSVTHGVSHRGQDHDITPLDAPCLHMNPVSFGSSALHLKRQFSSNKRKITHYALWDGECSSWGSPTLFPVSDARFRPTQPMKRLLLQKPTGETSENVCFTLAASFGFQQVKFMADSISRAVLKP